MEWVYYLCFWEAINSRSLAITIRTQWLAVVRSSNVLRVMAWIYATLPLNYLPKDSSIQPSLLHLAPWARGPSYSMGLHERVREKGPELPLSAANKGETKRKEKSTTDWLIKALSRRHGVITLWGHQSTKTEPFKNLVPCGNRQRSTCRQARY
jgi:hypothetical protein